MKVAKFTIKRGDIDHLIHSLKALVKMSDNPKFKQRFVACNLLENPGNKSVFGILKGGLRVVVQIDRGKEFNDNRQGMQKMPEQVDRIANKA